VSPRTADGSAGDADYGLIGGAYSDYRQADPRIAAHVEQALAGARTVVNVGAGAGSYESAAFDVTPVEPSASMRAQRPAHLPAAIDAVAERLPLADDAFDAAMTTFSIHQWSDPAAGLREMRRVARGPVAVLTCDPARVRDFWLYDYAPLVLDTEAARYPAIADITAALGGRAEVATVPVPADCTDGFNEAYYARPERLLDPAARRSCSAWSFVTPDQDRAYTEHLRADLASGAWDARYGAVRERPYLEGSLVLVRALP
jgi:SAM-dependent methyltransferase